MGYGTGHGRGRRVGGLAEQHAEFCARCAVAASGSGACAYPVYSGTPDMLWSGSAAVG